MKFNTFVMEIVSKVHNDYPDGFQLQPLSLSPKIAKPWLLKITDQ